MFRTVFPAFEEIDSVDRTRFYTMDINNQVYNNMYEGNTVYVYNFISGRTVSYLYRITLSFLRKGLDAQRHGAAMLNMVYGLIGIGTNTFNEKQQQSYLKSISALYLKLYANLLGGPDAENAAPETVLDFAGKEVADAIQEWVLFHESDLFGAAPDPNLAALADHIRERYSAETEKIVALRQALPKDQATLYRFSNDMQRLDYLIGLLEEDQSVSAGAGDQSRAEILLSLQDIKKAWQECMGDAVEIMASSISG
jgi:hypothetical protein